MKSNWLKWLSLAVMMGLLVAACAPAATEEPAPPPPATEAPQPPPAEAMIDCMGASSGDEVSVMYQWSGPEEEKINAIFAPFVEECGVNIVSESTRDDAVLDTRVQSSPPDVLFWASSVPSLLYTDQLQDLGSVGGHSENYADFWIEQGTVGGRWLTLPAKADIKTIIWYSPVQFETFGYEVPTTFAELDALVEQMVADGNTPWSMGMESGAATGWTGSDFIQDVMLVQQGPEYVMGLIDGSISYDDAGVQQAYETYAKWASDDAYTIGGSIGTVNTGFLDAIHKAFSDPPEAMMVKQSGFAGGEVVAQFPDLEYGVDFDFFAFPGAQGMQGGADFMMAFGDSPAAQALVGYLTSDEGGKAWAEVGFDLSPNSGAAGNYTDVQLAKKGDALAGATGFTPDLGDALGSPFNAAEWKAIIEVVQGGDVKSALSAAAASQRSSLALAPAVDCMGAEGSSVSMMSQWSGVEGEKINSILAPFLEACDISLVAEATRDDAVLDTRVKSDPPDILFWPNVSPMALYTDQLQDLGSVGANADNYADFWVEAGSTGGRWVMLPVKADIKTIVWYSPIGFETFGYAVPTTFAELDALVEQMVADGNTPWSMGMESGAATGWTGSDFIQDVLLAQQGPEYVMGLIDGSTAYDDAGVLQAYETYAKWASDETYTIGGSTGTVEIGFLDAIHRTFADPQEAMMVKQSGFAGGEVVSQFPDLEYGTDFDFFAFPGAQGMQGGADNLFVFGDSPATQALVAFVTSAEGAASWAKAGFDLSPNKWAEGQYADEQLAKKGAALAGATGFTPDLGDALGAPFNTAEWSAIIAAVQGSDIAAALAEAATAQAESLK